MNKVPETIALGFPKAEEITGMSQSFLRNAAKDPDPGRRLKTVRIATRRLIRFEDLKDWFDRVARDEDEAAHPTQREEICHTRKSAAPTSPNLSISTEVTNDSEQLRT